MLILLSKLFKIIIFLYELTLAIFKIKLPDCILNKYPKYWGVFVTRVQLLHSIYEEIHDKNELLIVAFVVFIKISLNIICEIHSPYT